MGWMYQVDEPLVPRPTEYAAYDSALIIPASSLTHTPAASLLFYEARRERHNHSFRAPEQRRTPRRCLVALRPAGRPARLLARGHRCRRLRHHSRNCRAAAREQAASRPRRVPARRRVHGRALRRRRESHARRADRRRQLECDHRPVAHAGRRRDAPWHGTTTRPRHRNRAHLPPDGSGRAFRIPARVICLCVCVSLRAASAH